MQEVAVVVVQPQHASNANKVATTMLHNKCGEKWQKSYCYYCSTTKTSKTVFAGNDIGNSAIGKEAICKGYPSSSSTSQTLEPNVVANCFPYKDKHSYCREECISSQYYINEYVTGLNHGALQMGISDSILLDNPVQTESNLKPKICHYYKCKKCKLYFFGTEKRQRLEKHKIIPTSQCRCPRPHRCQSQLSCQQLENEQHIYKPEHYHVNPNKYLSSIISIFPNRQLRQQQDQSKPSPSQYLHQNPSQPPNGLSHYSQHSYSHHLQQMHQHHHSVRKTAWLHRPSYKKTNIPLCQDLINIICILLLTLVMPHYMAQLPKPVVAGCRQEPSRSCEAICRPRWQHSDNDKIYYHAMHQHSVKPDSQTNDIANSTSFSSTLSSSSFTDSYPAEPLGFVNQSMLDFLNASYNCRIRALLLLPDNDTYVTSLRRVVPILKVAEQYLHESGLLPSFINFEWMPHDDKCDPAYAMVNVMDGIVKKCAHAIFGPTCEYGLGKLGRG